MGLCVSKPKDFGQFVRADDGELGIEHHIYNAKSHEDAQQRCSKVDKKLFDGLRKGKTSVGTPPRNYSGFSQ